MDGRNEALTSLTKRPWVVACVALILTACALWGAQDLHVEADIVRALEGDSDGYRAYARFQDRFGLGVADEVLLVRAVDLANPIAFDALENLVLDLQFTDGVAEVISLFSIPSENATTPLILTPIETPLALRFDALFNAGPAAETLVNRDRTAALMHVIAAEDVAQGAIASALPDLLQATAALDVRAVGQQAVERHISRGLIRDQAVVTPLAIFICWIVGYFILRSFRAVVVCSVPSIVGVLWFTGILGWLGQPLDPWLATLPTLLMVLAFADTVHLFYGSREPGLGLDAAIRQILPAAFLTSLTSALALASFGFVGTDALDGLAIWGPVAVGCGFASVCLVFPPLARLLPPKVTVRPATFSRVLAPAHLGLRRPTLSAFLAIGVALALLPTFQRAEPSFSLSEHIRTSSTLGEDLSFMDSERLGSASVFVEVLDTDGTPGLSEADTPRLSAVSEIALDGFRPHPNGLAQVPERFQARDGLSVALPVFLPLGAAPEMFEAEIDRVQSELESSGLADAIQLAGQSLLSHEVVPNTIASMRLSFYIALLAILIVVAISQRSFVLAVASAGISAMPMMAIEAVLVLTGSGMTMGVAIALTVAFGIAVDDTIHFLNRWRMADGSPQDRLAGALDHAGPPMVASTLIMSLGFVVTLFSAIASLPTFGLFVILSLWAALIADLLFLPALIRMLKR